MLSIVKKKKYKWIVIDQSFGEVPVSNPLSLIRKINITEDWLYSSISVGHHIDWVCECICNTLKDVFGFEIDFCEAYKVDDSFAILNENGEEVPINSLVCFSHKKDFAIILIRMHENIQHITLFEGKHSYLSTRRDYYTQDIVYEVKGTKKIRSIVYPYPIKKECYNEKYCIVE